MESGPNRGNAPLGGPVIPRSRRDLFKDQSFGDKEGYNANTKADRWHVGAACKGRGGAWLVVVYYCRTYEKAVSGGGEREKGGHVLRDTTSRGLYVRVWPPHTSERRGGGGGCEQEGWQGGEGRARMSGQEERQRHIRRC